MTAKPRTWGRGRSIIVSVRLSAYEKHYVQGRAKAADVTPSAFIREAALAGATGAETSMSGRFLLRLRLDLRRVHTGLQQAALHAGTSRGAEHLSEATVLLNAVTERLQVLSEELT